MQAVGPTRLPGLPADVLKRVTACLSPAELCQLCLVGNHRLCAAADAALGARANADSDRLARFDGDGDPGPGLENVGNVCCANATLQALMGSPAFAGATMSAEVDGAVDPRVPPGPASDNPVGSRRCAVPCVGWRLPSSPCCESTHPGCNPA